jgi:hypothetical protein
MKKMFIIVSAAISFAACNNNTSESNKNKDTSHTVTVDTNANVTTPGIKEITEHYLHIKNALAQDDGKDAANGGKALAEAFSKFDLSSLTTEQKKSYSDIVSDAKEHAEHIGMNADKIAHQREHFETLSKDIYDLVKTFPAPQVLYKDYCPMYNNGKGATWMSETKEIKNPYLGKKMPDCGEVKEEIK